ncbi:MAG: histidinol dehydrogenase [Sphaerochaetaceae bacterium]
MYLSREYAPQGIGLGPLLQRAQSDKASVKETVRDVLDTVRLKGDTALYQYESQFDNATLSSLEVTEKEFLEAETLVSDSLKQALGHAAKNIRAFHQCQMPFGEHLVVEEGVELSRKIVPIHTVGLYIPGGTAPLFSTVLMLAIPASVAKCPCVVMCTPPSKEGKVNPAILYAAKISGVSKVYKVGGAQAIAAMAYGTESIGKVDKIFGPGNRFVMEAKLQVASQCCAIDMPAGPSEVMVIADRASNPEFVASDLLSQAEHGPDSQAMLLLIADREDADVYLDKLEEAIAVQLRALPRTEFLLSSLSHSHAIVVCDGKSACAVANAYAPEHLIINTTNADELEKKIENAGSIFLGPWSCESAGDYASGTNHTLPTSGWAHSYSGVSVDSFLKKITLQRLSEQGLRNLAPTIETMAGFEMLDAHKNAVAIRIGESK